MNEKNGLQKMGIGLKPRVQYRPKYILWCWYSTYYSIIQIWIMCYIVCELKYVVDSLRLTVKFCCKNQTNFYTKSWKAARRVYYIYKYSDGVLDNRLRAKVVWLFEIWKVNPFLHFRLTGFQNPVYGYNRLHH